MESKIISQTKNPFLQREDITVEIKQSISPSKEEAIQAVGGKEDTTVIKKIHSNFGTNTFQVEAKVYDSVEAKDKVETIPQKVRKKMEADRVAAEASAKKEEEEKKKAEEEAKAAEEEKKVEEKNQAENEEAPVEEDKKEAPAPEVKEETKVEGKEE
jgi:ribosomal protein S24E